MIRVHLNGLKLIPGIDYSATNHTVSFNEAPAVGDEVLITSDIPGGSGSHMQRFVGNGSLFLYQLDSAFQERMKLQAVLDDAWTYQGVPAVQDILAQLKVVIELVKQDTPLKTK